MDRHDVHEIMDILAALCTIIVSIAAIWGSINLWSSGVWHKLMHVLNHYHHEIVMQEKADQSLVCHLAGKSQ
ncbi:MAG: hypothetical protein J6Y85_01375 [Alphaproteobacteria bacterium]|nr:hypothetical protein [Alphaproteobacteria bacterium]